MDTELLKIIDRVGATLNFVGSFMVAPELIGKQRLKNLEEGLQNFLTTMNIGILSLRKKAIDFQFNSCALMIATVVIIWIVGSYIGRPISFETIRMLITSSNEQKVEIILDYLQYINIFGPGDKPVAEYLQSLLEPLIAISTVFALVSSCLALSYAAFERFALKKDTSFRKALIYCKNAILFAYISFFGSIIIYYLAALLYVLTLMFIILVIATVILLTVFLMTVSLTLWIIQRTIKFLEGDSRLEAFVVLMGVFFLVAGFFLQFLATFD